MLTRGELGAAGRYFGSQVASALTEQVIRTQSYDLGDEPLEAVNATTGELLRHLTLDPTKDYQPTGRPPGPPARKPKLPEP